MERSVAMPKLGMTMTEGTIVRWHVGAGDTVAKDDILAEVETDKVELEIEAPFAGRVVRVVAAVGQPIAVGEPIIFLETAQAPTVGASPTAPADRDTNSATPRVGTDDALATAPPPAAGRQRLPSTPAARRLADEHALDLAAVAAHAAAKGQTGPLRAADVLAYSAEVPVAQPTTLAEAVPSRPLLTPLARKLAAAERVPLEDLAAAPNGRRLTRREVQEALSARASIHHANGSTPVAPPRPVTADAAMAVVAEEDADFVPLTAMRRTIAERTTHSFTTTPHIYLDLEVDMTAAEELRQARAAVAERQGERAPSATAILVQVVAAALARHPQVNAGYVPARGTSPAGIRRWHGVHVGVAVALPDGLLVPVVRDADRKPLATLADEIAALGRGAREGTLRPDDLAGATFTISNLGMYGIDTFHAVLNEPQSAILAVGRITPRATVVAGADGGQTIAIRPILKLSLSADHRVLDGAAGARFLATVRELLEDPRLLL